MMTEDELIEAVLAAPLSDADRISQLQDCVELMSRIAQTGDAKKIQEAAGPGPECWLERLGVCCGLCASESLVCQGSG